MQKKGYDNFDNPDVPNESIKPFKKTSHFSNFETRRLLSLFPFSMETCTINLCKAIIIPVHRRKDISHTSANESQTCEINSPVSTKRKCNCTGVESSLRDYIVNLNFANV